MSDLSVCLSRKRSRRRRLHEQDARHVARSSAVRNKMGLLNTAPVPTYGLKGLK